MRPLDAARDLALDLVSDCAQCAAVCCVATSFDASEDFALAKPAGVGCRYLRPDCRCGIHDQLVERGFRGCAIYDCFGAGPRVTRAFAGRPGSDRERNEVFLVLRVVHELLWLLTQAQILRRRLRSVRADHAQRGEVDREIDGEIDCEIDREIDREIDGLDAIAALPPAELLALDLRAHVGSARAVLRRVGDAIGGRERAARVLAVRPRQLRRAC